VATENEATEADRGGDAQQCLVSALRSLETVLSDHTQLMTKRLRRELTVKGREATAQTPAKTGQRGDKVQYPEPSPALEITIVNNKCSKYFDERTHRRGRYFMGEFNVTLDWVSGQ